MEQAQKLQITKWGKRIAGTLTFFIWIGVIISISRSPEPFTEQAPYCMLSTMIIFGILTSIFKGLDYWEKGGEKKEEE